MPEVPGVRPDVALYLLAVILYVADAAQLLFHNEVLFVRGPARGWSPRFAHQYPEIARRFLALPRLLEPYCAVLRAVWPGSTTDDGASPEVRRGEIDQRLGLLTQLQWGSALLLPQIFVGLPLVYGLHGGDLLLLITLGIIYLQVLLMVMVLFWRRRSLGIGLGKTVLIAIESLVCIPYAINLYRKTVRDSVPTEGNFLALAQALFTPAELTAFRSKLAVRVDARLHDANRKPSERLQIFRKQLDLES